MDSLHSQARLLSAIQNRIQVSGSSTLCDHSYRSPFTSNLLSGPCIIVSRFNQVRTIRSVSPVVQRVVDSYVLGENLPGYGSAAYS